MIRRHTSTLRVLLMLGDAAVALLVLAIVSQLRFGSALDKGLREFTPSWAPLGLYVFGWVLLLFVEGEYRPRSQWSLRIEARGIVRAGVWMALASFTVLFLTDLADVSRLFLLALFPAQILATVVTRGVLRWWFVRHRAEGRNARQVLVVGTGRRALAFAKQIESHAELGLHIVGFLGDESSEAMGRWRYLGPVVDLERVLHAFIVDEVALCLPMTDRNLVESVAHVCQDEGKVVRIPLEVPQFGTGTHIVEDLDGTAVLSLTQGPDRVIGLAIKRAIDLLGATAAIIVLSPVILLTALLILLRDGRPIFFSQERIGLNGRPFRVHKFRTMIRGAEDQVDALKEHNEIRGNAFKMTSDPRITPLGRRLRRASLDELPQLWNVIRGEMSIVGPRPPLPNEVADYDVWHRRRLSMKPGVTGLWQVEARREPEFDRWVERDLEYIDRWSLLLDLKILLNTVPAVLRLQGR